MRTVLALLLSTLALPAAPRPASAAEKKGEEVTKERRQGGAKTGLQHPSLAKERRVRASGTLTVKGGRIVIIRSDQEQSGSGHFRPEKK